MIDDIKTYLGASRLANLERRMGKTPMADEIMLSVMAATRRGLTGKGAVVFASIHLLRVAGVRPSPDDNAAWREATETAAREQGRATKPKASNLRRATS